MLNGQTITGQATFNVYRPSITFTDSPPSWATNDMVDGTLSLALGSSSGIGSMFYRVDVSSAYSGKIDFTQLINRSAANGDTSDSTSSQYWMDNTRFYLSETNSDSFIRVNANLTKPLSFNDGPSFALAHSLIGGNTTSIFDQFKDYVMFRPDNGNVLNNIYVPLGKITWSWSASTTYSGGVWSLPYITITRKEHNSMFNHIYRILLVETILFKAFVINAQPSNPTQIFGEITNNLQPEIEIERSGTHSDDWNIEIDYLAHTNFAKFTWLKPSQRIGSKLRLWSTNGAEFITTNSVILATDNLSSKTTVLNIMKDIHPSNRRGILWLQIEPGMSYGLPSFNLTSYYNISFTNDYVLQITPLLYKVETNGITAHLVEFPTLKVKLSSNGSVQQMK